jgi:acylphosphatase
MTKIKIIHKNITIKGRVQGVGFRFATRTMAISLGIRGYVKNLSSGEVYIEAEGTEIQLRHLTDWCYKGPDYAHVENVTIEEGKIAGYQVFDIRH